jgi:hypothetical protein
MESSSPKKFKIGDHVRFIKKSDGKSVNGRVKAVHNIQKYVYVVFNCGGNWDHFMSYTSELTNIDDLELGWKRKLNFKVPKNPLNAV